MINSLNTFERQPAPAESNRRVYSAGDAPLPDGPRSLGLYRHVANGLLFAVEMVNGWIPVRAVGPLEPSAVPDDLSSLDWNTAADAKNWNAARLVKIDADELARLRAGVRRRTTLVRTSQNVAMQVSVISRVTEA